MVRWSSFWEIYGHHELDYHDSMNRGMKVGLIKDALKRSTLIVNKSNDPPLLINNPIESSHANATIRAHYCIIVYNIMLR